MAPACMISKPYGGIRNNAGKVITRDARKRARTPQQALESSERGPQLQQDAAALDSLLGRGPGAALFGPGVHSIVAQLRNGAEGPGV